MMDTERLQKLCEGYLTFREGDEYYEGNDWPHYIYEVALETVLGNDIWKRFREIDRKKEIKRKQKEIEKLQAELDTESEKPT